MSTPINTLYLVMRALLGDRKVRGCWAYEDSELFAGVASVFALGRQPVGFSLDTPSDISKAKAITPDLPTGNQFARVCYEAVLIMVGGEERGGTLVTRSMTVRDSGQRQRSLLAEVGLKLHRLDAAEVCASGGSGGGDIATFQSLAQWIGAHQAARGIEPYFELASVTPVDIIGNLTF